MAQREAALEGTASFNYLTLELESRQSSAGHSVGKVTEPPLLPVVYRPGLGNAVQTLFVIAGNVTPKLLTHSIRPAKEKQFENVRLLLHQAGNQTAYKSSQQVSR